MIGDDEVVEIDLDDTIELDPEGERETAEKKTEKAEKTAKAEPSGEAHTSEEVAPEVYESLRKQLDNIKAERDAAHQAKAQAELEARKHAQEAERAKQSADQSYYQLVDGYVHQAKSKSSQIKQEIKLALDAGEYDKVSELQMEAARVSARLLQYEDAKADLEARARRDAEKPKIERTIDHTDPFEAQISTLSEPSKQWLRQHKECVLDDVASAKVVLGDKLARRNGMVPDSKEYFEFIEEHMGYKTKPEPKTETKRVSAEDDGFEVEVAEARPVKKPMPAAPVSREAGHQGRPMNGKVYLSKAEAEIAESLGMTKAEYAKWKIKADQDGRYTN